jgi:hypothetical protein
MRAFARLRGRRPCSWALQFYGKCLPLHAGLSCYPYYAAYLGRAPRGTMIPAFRIVGPPGGGGW